jgi:hypothetical protein
LAGVARYPKLGHRHGALIPRVWRLAGKKGRVEGARLAPLWRARGPCVSSQNHRPCESGAEATAIQTLARWREAGEPREACGSAARSWPLWRAHGPCESSQNHRPCESGAEATAVQTLARWRVAGAPREACGSAARSPPLWRARGRCESSQNQRPCESGAKATVVQTLARWREAGRCRSSGALFLFAINSTKMLRRRRWRQCHPMFAIECFLAN